MSSYAKALKHKILTRAEEQYIFQQMESENKNIAKQAREKMITSNFRLAMSIAQKYRHSKLSMEDIYQEANIGLIKAVDRFDWKKGFRFSTYACWWIKQSIRNYVSSFSSHLKFPSNSRILIYKINNIKKEYKEEFGVIPTDIEIAELVGESVKTVKGIVSGYKNPVRLDSYFGGDDSNRKLHDMFGDDDALNPETIMDKKLLIEIIKNALGSLTAQEEKVLRLRYGIVEDPNDPEKFPTRKCNKGDK